MDAHSRGRADDIDPADQWVLNPDTGHYELRLTPSAGRSPASAPPRRRSERAAAVPGQRARRTAAPAGEAGRTASGRGNGGRAGGGRPAGRGAAPGDQAGRRRPKSGRSGKKRALMWTGGLMGLVLVGGSTAGYLYFQHLNGNIGSVDTLGVGGDGFNKGEAVNILLLGTDKRSGKGNEGYGDAGSTGHADTTILLHVSKDRTNATALSIPRDMIVDIPDCPTKQEDGSTKVIPGTPNTRFNESLGQAGRDPGCTMLTAQEVTGLQVDHFMMADFNAIKTMTTAVGGVEVCLAKDIDDPGSHLKLSAGKHVLEGEQALGFVRTRKSFGNRSDLDRIKTQQQFLGSLVRKLKSNDTLTSPTKIVKLAEAATDSLTVDSKIASILKLKDLGLEIGKVEPKNISFATIPVVDNTDGATVLMNEQPAEQLFAMMRDDISLTAVKKKEKAEEAAKLKGPKAAPGDVRVDVYNGGAPAGSASTALAWLQNEQGVLKSTNQSNAPANVKRTRLEYGPDQAEQARTLAAMMGLSSSALKPAAKDAGAGTPMTLTLGPDYKGPGIPLTPPSKAPEGVQKVEADKTVCAE
ncbi:LCP family protein [Streptomyces sp. NPDC060194]|uniref:LCP family protein n=1 Tax=Streptomyces sp. NPDC060194 TaxID=3347069 RepID=UPI003650A30A